MPPLWTLIKNVTKISIAGAAVKLTYDNGVWDTNTEKGRRLYEQAKQKILPGTIEYPKQLPSCREMELCAQSTWNNGVQSSFRFIVDIPDISKRTVCAIRVTFDKDHSAEVFQYELYDEPQLLIAYVFGRDFSKKYHNKLLRQSI